MNPVEIGKGRGFKGLARYLLHHEDRSQDAALSERVAWTQSFNLNDAPADRAWRLMTSTAMSAEALKAAAGIRKGKPTEKAVYHYSVTFNPEDAPTAELQRKAAAESLRALGLQDYQALAVAHRDTDHLHVHVMVNLISIENGVSAASKQPDGRPSPLSNSRMKLSKWAMAFERENGLTITAGRIANQTARANGEAVTGTKRLSRPEYEHRQREGTEARTAWMRREAEDRRHALAKDQEAMRERQTAEWDALKEAYRQEKAARTAAQTSFKTIAAGIREEWKPRWRELFQKHRQEAAAFDRSERGLGMVWNAVTTAFRVGGADGAKVGLTAALSREGRRDGMVKRHRRETDQLQAIVRDHIQARIDKFKRYDARTAEEGRKSYLARCAGLRAKHDGERDAMQERWRLYNDERRERAERVRAPVRDRGQERGQGRQWGIGRGLEP